MPYARLAVFLCLAAMAGCFELAVEPREAEAPKRAPAAPLSARKLRVELLPPVPGVPDHFVFLITNESDVELALCWLDFELRDDLGRSLGRGDVMVLDLPPGESSVEHLWPDSDNIVRSEVSKWEVDPRFLHAKSAGDIKDTFTLETSDRPPPDND
jgi:hypothetical protein